MGSAPDPAPPAAERLRRVARLLCAEARVGDAQHEPLIATLERRWLTRPSASRRVPPARRAVVWQRLTALYREEATRLALVAECGGAAR